MGYTSDAARADRTTEAAGFPEVVLIDSTSACNLRCSMCDHRNIRRHRRVQTMDAGLYRRLIDQIACERPDARVWLIFFGEPCLVPDMPERIRYAKDRGLTDVVLNSNGVLLDASRARAYVEAGLDAMYVGIDAARRATYEAIRVGGDFRAAVANVLGYRDRLAESGRPGQRLFVQFVVSDVNEAEVEAFRAFWTGRGVAVKVRPKVSWAGLVAADNLRANARLRRRPCYWLMRTINICADGTAALCSVDVHCRVPCGDARHRSLRALWNGDLKRYRALHRAGRFDELPPMCRDCADWQSAYADFVCPEPQPTA